MGWLKELFTSEQRPPSSAANLGRNERCWCGSGKKYKKCHFQTDKVYFAEQVASVTCTSGG